MFVLVYVAGLVLMVGLSLYVDHRIGHAVRARLVRWSGGRVLRGLAVTVLAYVPVLLLAAGVASWSLGLDERPSVAPWEYGAYVLAQLVLAIPCGVAVPSRNRPVWPLVAKFRAEEIPLSLARAMGWPASILGTIGFGVLALTPLPVLAP